MSWDGVYPVVVPNPPADNTDTANFEFRLPTYSGDPNSWGYGLNGNWFALDAILFSVYTVSNAALPKAGGVMTGDIEFALPVEDDEETEEDETQLQPKCGTNAKPSSEVNTAAINIVPTPGDDAIASWGDDGIINAVDVVATSDEALKHKVEAANCAQLLKAVCALQPVVYEWRSTPGEHLGFIAQRVREHLPNAVCETTRRITEEGGRHALGISNPAIVAALVGAVKALAKENADLLRRMKLMETMR